MTTDRLFPVLKGVTLKFIPWGLLDPHRRQADRNHGQTLEKLADRGGLSAEEAMAVIEGRRWTPLPDAEDRLRAAAAAFLR